jgi:2-polyprenyl-6-methoxyphenol hydroxylase-like FAD-dependent oxidoreductase
MPQRHLETDVVVAGAGPTGLMLANCLARLGVGVVVLDGKAAPTRESRALVLQARTMEVYDQLGMGDRVLAATEKAGAIVPGFEKRRFRAVNLRRLAEGITPYPHLYVLEQSENERLLVENLDALGVNVQWNHELESLTAQPGGGVEVRSRGDELIVSARYCVGADGTSSLVRSIADVAFEGVTNQHTFYVADAVGVRGLVLDSINLRFGERDFLLSFPMGAHDHERLLGVVRTPEDEPVPEVSVREMLERVFSVTYTSTRWFSTYRVHHRVAARFRAGSVFLAGDAAHVHSPVGAQGMNTGLQDAHNLACKIADVLARRATERYLDRYEAERRPVAKRLIGTTDTLFGIVTSDKRSARLFRRWFVQLFAPIGTSIIPRLGASSRLFEYVSQTRIHYWMSDEAKRAAHGRRGKVVGRRLPWNGDNYESLRAMSWQVHVYGGFDEAVAKRLESDLGLPVSTFPEVHHRRLEPGMFYLVRPDGFVAASAQPETAAVTIAAAVPWASA